MTKILVLGGAKSGKTKYALNFANGWSDTFIGDKVYIATTIANETDEEMILKVKAHKEERDESWTTIEEPHDINIVLRAYSKKNTVFVIDCLTMWLFNIIEKDLNFDDEVEKLVETIKFINCSMIFISNEIGLGVIGNTREVRKFVNMQGILNQKITDAVDMSKLIIGGHAICVKGQSLI